MAIGTGLPSDRGQVATTITDMAGYGAAEEATARALSQAADGLDRLTRVIEPAAQDAARTIAEQKVAAGEFEQRVAITGADQAFNEAIRTGTLARLSNQRDADLDRLRTEHAFDPEGFERAAAEYRTSALNAAVPGALAIEWGQEFDARATRTASTIRAARAQADLQEAKGAAEARIERLTRETIDATGGRPWETLADDPDVQGNILQIQLLYEGLAANPAFGMSEEEAALRADETITEIIGGAVASEHVNILRNQGIDAALASIETLNQNGAQYPDLTRRNAIVARARAAVADEYNLTQQRLNVQNAQRAVAEQEVARLIEADVANYTLTGAGTGVTEDQIRALGGQPAVLRWHQAKARATEDRRLYENLPTDPDDAADEIARRVSQQVNLNTGLPVITDMGDLSTYTAAIEIVESGGRNGLVSADPDGAGPAGGGAMGVRQLLPETARLVAQRLGLPFDAERLRTDVAYNRQLSDAYFGELVTRYNGDAFLAVTAYHAGPGNVDGWLQSVGDPRTGAISREEWLNGVEARGNPRSAEYPRKVLRAMQGGRAAAAWDQHQGNLAQRRADPAATVLREPDVAAARANWRANLTDPEAGGGMVRAFLNAQERQGIRQGDRRSLPNEILVPYARALAGLERDPAGYTAMSEAIIERFGDYGERVLQDVLTLRGNTAYAAQIAAAATNAGRTGTPPPTPSQARTAGNAEAMNRAASGQAPTNTRGMSDQDLLNALGGSPL